jgi:hypothetical protein
LVVVVVIILSIRPRYNLEFKCYFIRNPGFLPFLVKMISCALY